MLFVGDGWQELLLVQACLLASIGSQAEDIDTYVSVMNERVRNTSGASTTACTAIWKAGTLAYRCKTCQTSSNSAICKDCFQVQHANIITQIVCPAPSMPFKLVKM